MNVAGLGVAHSEEAPRLVDVGLLLCTRCLRMCRGFLINHSEWSETLFTWLLRKIAFVHTVADIVPSSADTGMHSSTLKPPHIQFSSSVHSDERIAAYHRGEVNFSAAFHDAQNTVSVQTADSSNMDGMMSYNRLLHRYFNRRNMVEAPSDAGYALLLEFLHICETTGGSQLVHLIISSLKHVLGEEAAENEEEIQAVADLSVLSELFVMDDAESESLEALGSSTRCFIVWVNLSWTCASFAHQARVAATVSGWMGHLLKSGGATVHRILQEVTVHAAVDSHQRVSMLPEDVNSCDFLHLGKAHRLIRDIFEGHRETGSSMMSTIFSHSRHSQLPDNYIARLLQLQGPSVASILPRHELQNRGTQPLLYNTTCGMLLYVQFYLTIRSLHAAQQCAQMAVLVGHHLHSNEILALAHYSCFLVYLSAGRPLEAADSISISLQLATAATRAADSGSGDVRTGALGYMGAAQLLLYYPGTVGSSLRSALATGLSSWSTLSVEGRGDAQFDSSTVDAAATTGGNDLMAPGGLAVEGSNSVVVQTVAQTVRHVLWLSEREAFYNPSPQYSWLEIVCAISRETLLVVGSIYGILSCPTYLDVTSVGHLLTQLSEDVAVTLSHQSLRPPTTLLVELIRHRAHSALAYQQGSAEPPRMVGPVTVLRDFLLAVQVHYGAAGLAAVEESIFFFMVSMYVTMCWLIRNGFMLAAFEGLTELVGRLYHAAGIEAEEGAAACHGAGVGTANAEDERSARLSSAVEHCSTDDSATVQPYTTHSEATYWPPDHLLLLAYVQLRRAEVAIYLGFAQVVQEISSSLNAICSRCHFVMGVLIAQLIAAMDLQQKGRHSSLLVVLEKITNSGEKIGLSHFTVVVKTKQISTLMQCGRWVDALNELATLPACSPHLRSWCLLMELNAGSEVLLRQPTCTMEDVEKFVADARASLIANGLLAGLESMKRVLFEGDSVGPTLVDLLCLHASVARMTQPLEENHGSHGLAPTAVSSLMQMLHRRHLQGGCLERVMHGTLLEQYDRLLSGNLAEELESL